MLHYRHYTQYGIAKCPRCGAEVKVFRNLWEEYYPDRERREDPLFSGKCSKCNTAFTTGNAWGVTEWIKDFEG